MSNFILRKLVRAALTLLFAVTFVFILLRLSGDPAVSLYGDDAPPEATAYFEAQFGLDRPVAEQYVNYIARLLRGDLGLSFRERRPAVNVVADVLPETLFLGAASLALALLLGIPAGFAAAVSPNGRLDRAVMAMAVSGYALPNFFLGVLLILVFTMNLRWLPSAGGATLAHLILPTITLGTAYAGILARFFRAAMRDALAKPFVAAARGRGFTELGVALLHALPNASLPTVTVVGLLVGGVVSGAVVTETVFAWPGAGHLLVQAVERRDLPVIQVLILLATLAMVIVNLLVDILYGFLDPRIRVAGGQGGQHV